MIAPIIAVVALLAASSVGAERSDGPDVRVATLTDGRCGDFADSLPALIGHTGARPGNAVGDVTVCVTNAGGEGRLSLRVVELVDVDPACTGEEATLDRTCGGGRRGELSPSLLQQVGVGECPAGPPTTTPALDRRLPALRSGPLVLVDRLRRDEIACVRLRLLYEPPDTAASVTSQTDRTTWRYAFGLSATGG